MIRFLSLPDLVSYEDARSMQLRLVEERIKNEIPDTLLFLEHHPVITRGRGLQFTGEKRERHMPMTVPLPPHIAYTETERGGDLTYHGPGQLVVYPIFKLEGVHALAPSRDVGKFLRGLENLLVEFLKDYGLPAQTREAGTGVWLGDKKIASIGIAVRKWVTFHGMAINVVNDLSSFQYISPCGFSPEVMTKLDDWFSNEQFGERGWRGWLEEGLRRKITSSVLNWEFPASEVVPAGSTDHSEKPPAWNS